MKSRAAVQMQIKKNSAIRRNLPSVSCTPLLFQLLCSHQWRAPAWCPTRKLEAFARVKIVPLPHGASKHASVALAVAVAISGIGKRGEGNG